MSSTKNDIRAMLNRAPEGSTHAIIVCDTFDYEDYPVFVRPGQDVHAVYEECKSGSMQRVMEVYNLNMDIEDQLAESRAFNF